MDDVKPDVSNAQEAPVESEPTVQVPQSENETADVPTVAEKTVPYQRFQEVNKNYKEAQRKLAEVEGNQKLQQYDPEDMDAVLSNPFVQELLLKDAKRELADFARDELDKHPNFHPQLKKAILSNARGFVNESTTDVESAKLDLLEYIEGIAEEEAGTQTPTTTLTNKSFPIASTNISKTDVPGARPADIAKLMLKPMEEWTPEEGKAFDDYKRLNPSK